MVLTLFLLFFVVPVLWLVLAATKTDGQPVQGNPLIFGSWHALRVNWDKLTAYQSDVLFLWLRNSASWPTGPTTSFLTSCCPRAASSRCRWAAPAGDHPALVVFLFSQSYLVAGLLTGATKG